MNHTKRPPRRIFLKFITAITIAVYLLAVAGWYISPIAWWPLGFASIAFAYLWLALLLLAVWWWFKKQRLIPSVCFALMVTGFQPAKATFSIGWDKDYMAEKAPATLRVMQWNCKGLPGNVIGWQSNKAERKAVETFILQYKPDIICMEDFAEHTGRILESNFAFLKDTLGFPYKIFAESSIMIHEYGKTKTGTVIFSKYPFIRSGILPFENRDLAEYIVWADVLLQGKPVRLATTHFKSMNLFGYNTYDPDKLPYYHKSDSSIIMSKNIITKIKFFQAEHTLQAQQLNTFLDTCSVPVVLCIDMNTVPAGFNSRKAKGKLKDGFIGSKTGMGNTYNFLLPNLRIDYLLHHPALEARQWKHFTNGFFDHDHLMADFTWKIE